MNFPTVILIQLLAQNPKTWFEVTLFIKSFRATHFLFYDKGELADEGIDGETTQTTLSAFFKFIQTICMED